MSDNRNLSSSSSCVTLEKLHNILQLYFLISQLEIIRKKKHISLFVMIKLMCMKCIMWQPECTCRQMPVFSSSHPIVHTPLSSRSMAKSSGHFSRTLLQIGWDHDTIFEDEMIVFIAVSNSTRRMIRASFTILPKLNSLIQSIMCWRR